MSFLGGAECSAAANPLRQFVKHTQDDQSLQRDRLVGNSAKSLQGMRSISGIDSTRNQDTLLNEFRHQNGPLSSEIFALQQDQPHTQTMRIGPPSLSAHGWAQEFVPGIDTQTRMEFSNSTPTLSGLSPADFVAFQQTKSGTPMMSHVKEHQVGDMYSSYFNSQMDMGGMGRNMGMGIGLGMGMNAGAGYMSRAQFQNQGNFQQQDKGKGKMVELDDEHWEEQFKKIDLEGRLRDDAALTDEADVNQVDQTDHETETNEFGDFESIWKGILSEAAVAQELSKNDMGIDEDSGDLEQWGAGLQTPFRDPQLGDYMFEENNMFKEISNPFEEGVRIVEAGGNLSLAALAFEAAVQNEPDHIDAWVMLGSAQAQNEKETPAIRALEQALKLDPANLSALMGLAVSYTNEGYDSTAYRTLERWLSYKYPNIAPSDRSQPLQSDVGFTDRFALHERVTELFINAAQLSPDGEHMDPDVQVGLGVLFYGAEEYEKAVDCFSAALASTDSGTSNQQDQIHLLWNRLGATLANSGRSEEAITAYEKALTLRPNFVRARYNLGVSCINIGCLEEAASHLLGALAMHKIVENEGREKARDILNGNGNLNEAEIERMIHQNQSTNLYDTLRRVFSQMGRRDLADRVAADMDIESFRADFDF
ncbi:BgTH12-01046 [Blumeria graminis f. sp. triticale]|uniref:Peroxisomal targeting signal receptor n=1 Tax=Blumeria graminis f. sp. triticale TaxID=1689686 RepID=A0A9W4DS37_BLUGR|nr:BgTH12-01046 [Blumeria graminis f. sp. triticale]